jgi:hypothetical protein
MLLLYLLLVVLTVCGCDAHLPVSGGVLVEERGEATERSETRPSSPAPAARRPLARRFVSAGSGPQQLSTRAPDLELPSPRCRRIPMRC